MSSFSCPVCRVISVESHPGADRLSIVKVLGYTCISGKLNDGSHRYSEGDLCVYIPSASLLPEWLLKEMDFWNTETNIGTLSGPNGNRVKPMRLRGIFSEGVLYNTKAYNLINGEYPPSDTLPRIAPPGSCGWSWTVAAESKPEQRVLEGDDVSEYLGIEKYSPPIPTAMAGEVANLFGFTQKYDFERVESVPDMFNDGEMVIATEKLHGTFVCISFIPNLNHSEMFGTNGEIIVHSKGLGASGLAFKNVEHNAGNIYVRTLNSLLEKGLETKLHELVSVVSNNIQRISIFGEIFGKGIQDLHYGFDKPVFRMFDLQIDNDWMAASIVNRFADMLGIEMVPLLYTGPFDKTILDTYRDGKTALGGGNVREGIVVRSLTENRHAIHGRKIVKMISPDYLLRKVKNGEATEFN